MKNFLVFLAGVVVTVLILGVAGFAYAQTRTPPTPGTPQGVFPWGMMGARGYSMMGGWRNQGTPFGPMHQYMVDAFADVLGLSPEELQTSLNEGKTMWQIADEKGFEVEEFKTLMQQARTKALNQAVEDGLLSLEQADWMTEHMNQLNANGFGPGFGHCGGYGRFPGFRGGPGGRWNLQPTPAQ